MIKRSPLAARLISSEKRLLASATFTFSTFHLFQVGHYDQLEILYTNVKVIAKRINAARAHEKPPAGRFFLNFERLPIEQALVPV
jgi:hypothetical protein